MFEVLTKWHCSNGNWTTRGYANSRTGHLADWSTRGLDNSHTSQLADWTTRGLADAAKRTKTKHAKSPVASASCPVRDVQYASCLVRKLTSPWDVQSVNRPIRELAWRIRKLSSNRSNTNAVFCTRPVRFTKSYKWDQWLHTNYVKGRLNVDKATPQT